MTGNPTGGEPAPAPAFEERLADLLKQQRDKTEAALDVLRAEAPDSSDDAAAKIEYSRRAAGLIATSQTLELIQTEMFGTEPAPPDSKE